jgi:hypothetical protein
VLDAKRILLDGLRDMHGLLDKAIADMTVEQLNWRPERGLSAFFSLWHYVRTEDNIVNFVAQGRNTVWLEGGYDQRLGLPRTSQGTGMTPDEAVAIVLRDVDVWRAYQQATWRATHAFVESLSAEDLEGRTVTIKPLGPMPLWDALWGVCLSHGFRHVGEIEYVRGLLGLGGLTI